MTFSYMDIIKLKESKIDVTFYILEANSEYVPSDIEQERGYCKLTRLCLALFALCLFIIIIVTLI